MPKGKRRERVERHYHGGRDHEGNYMNLNLSDDESIIDNASIVSNSSEMRSGEDGDDSEILVQDQLEEKLCENIDGLTQKSSQGRINCFEALSKAFIKKSMPGFIKDRHFTICDSIERSLKKGTGPEKIAAVELASVICVQLGGEDTTEVICQLLKPLLLILICDNTVAASVRAKCCTALGNITFLSGGEIGDVILLMQQFETIFSASYLKGDGSVPTISSDLGVLHAAAIQAWNLLFTLLSPGNIGTMINNSKALPSLEKLSELLQSPHLDVRLAAGEALSLIYELGREESNDFEEDFALDITENLKQLATDSHKYRAKKDRKQQRATFRDILQFIEDDVVPELQIKFGKETLILDSWVRRKQYETLCNILGPSINVHLMDNDMLREIFEISAPPPTAVAPNQDQMERYRKRLINAANYKARTVSRARNRDKRSDF